LLCSPIFGIISLCPCLFAVLYKCAHTRTHSDASTFTFGGKSVDSKTSDNTSNHLNDNDADSEIDDENVAQAPIVNANVQDSDANNVSSNTTSNT
jgi:hypothetical protein